MELTNKPFQHTLSDKQVELLEKFLAIPEESLQFLRTILMDNARSKGLEIPEVNLRLAQLRPVAMSYVNPRFFIGDKPGLGKTVMSAGCVALYQTQQRKRGLPVKKVLIVTDTSHVKGFSNEWNRFGLPLLPLAGGKANILRALKNENLADYDGVIVNWDTLKSNTFIEFYIKHKQEFEMAVFDETSHLLNKKNQLYKVTNLIVNEYQGGIPRVIFLNGSSFEKNILDFYAQFSILSPKLIPNLQYLEQNFIIRGGRQATQTDYFLHNGYMHVQHMLAHTGEIVDYKNQEILRENLRYYYIARSKSDYSSDIPEHSYILYLIDMTKEQEKTLQSGRIMSKVNSPATSNPNADMSRKALPKLDFLVKHIQDVLEDRPIVYAFNIEAQHAIARELTGLGLRVGIINGDQGIKQRDIVLTQFNERQLDTLVFNVQKAINIPTSNRIVFWDIPTMPQLTSQVIGRIDRNNYDQSKFYDFLCYINSPEMENLVRLAYFREQHASAFTGQQEFVYATLQQQLQNYINQANLETAHDLLNQVDNQEVDYNESIKELDQLLRI